MRRLTITILSLFLALNIFAERIDMGACKSKSAKDNTKFIAQKIAYLADKCGGGTLYFPAGVYNVGPIELKSNTTLELEAGALLKFSNDMDLYTPFVEVRYEGVVMKTFKPLIYAVDCENITIKGEGTIDGQGKAWWNEKFKVDLDVRDRNIMTTNKYQQMWEDANDVEAIKAETNVDWAQNIKNRFFRPPFIQPVRCKNVKIEGIHIQNSPFWTVNPEFCDNVTVHGITINNPLSPNTDGINPESCKNVHISDCHISVGDDCITIKAGRDYQARKIGVPCENITITNCTMLSGHGGVVIGSEMSGGVKKVTISNCVFDGTDRGIRIKSTRGRGGVVEDIRVSNIVMSNIKQEAVVFNLKYSKMQKEEKTERTPTFRNIHISDMICRGVKTPIKIVGLEEAPISNISLKNINITEAKDKCIFEDCNNILMDKVVVNGEEVKLDL